MSVLLLQSGDKLLLQSGDDLLLQDSGGGGAFDPSTGFGYVTQTPMYRSKTEVIAY